MLESEVRRINPTSIRIYSIIHVFLYVIVLSLLIIVNDFGYINDYVWATLTILFLINLLFHLTMRKKRIYRFKYQISSLKNKIDLPTSFIKKGRLIMADGRKCYVINHQVIPAKFVEFVEGRRAYLIKELSEIHPTNIYTLIYLHQNHYALIEDAQRKRYIVHVDNLEIIQ